MVDDFFKITLTIGRIGYIRRRERSIRRDCELFSYREFIIEKNDWRMSEIFIIEIYNSEIGVSRNEDWEYLIRNIVIISLSSVDVELWNRFLKHVDIVVGYRLESIRQTEGEIDVIVQSNLEMDKEYQQSSLYFLRVGIFKLQAYTLIFTTYFSYFNTLNFYPRILEFYPRIVYENRIFLFPGLQISLSNERTANSLQKRNPVSLYREGYRVWMGE